MRIFRTIPIVAMTAMLAHATFAQSAFSLPQDPELNITVFSRKLPALQKGHPRIFANDSDKATILEKIGTAPWAKELYEKQILGKVKPYVERHRTDPDWIISRLQMNWEAGKHYTRAWASGNSIRRREGDALYPTVRLAAGRAGNGSHPGVDQIIPYGTKTVMQLRDGKPTETPWAETGIVIEENNHDILQLAYDASIVYWLTGEQDYAKFAADIIWVFCRGAAQQEQLNPDEEVNSFGFLSYETLGDSRRYKSIPLTYDFIHDYLDKNYFTSDEFIHGRKGSEKWAPGHSQGKEWAHDQFQTMFRKMIDNKLTRGGGLEGNWNLNEHDSAILYALALDDDEQFEDKHGRQYYIDQLLYRTTPTNGAYCNVLRANVDAETGLWPEAPAGYGQGAIQQLIQFAAWYRKAGIDLFERDDLLLKAACAFPSIAFPNGRSTAWGDGGYNTIYTRQAEFMIAYAREKKDAQLEETFTKMIQSAGKRDLGDEMFEALFFFVPELNQYQGAPKMPRASFSDAHALLISRNIGDTPYNSFAYSVFGVPIKAGHYHENGLAMELFGRGENLGADFGAGPNYWDEQHRYFNRMAVGHNTVVVNGIEIGTKDAMPIEIIAADPMPIEGKDDVRGKSDKYQFSEVATAFHSGGEQADMRRINAIVRLDNACGFLVDIFRVKMTRGKVKHLDYIYHNMGTDLKHSATGPVAEFNQDDGCGYSYLKDVAGRSTKENISGEIPYPVHNISMRFFLPGNGSSRDFFSMRSPANFRHYQNELKSTPVPTFMLRRTDDDTWTKPFIAIYEPVGDDAPPRIESVQCLETPPELTAIEVILKDGKKILILSSLNQYKTFHVEGIAFRGSFAIITDTDLYSETSVLSSASPILKRD